MPAPWGDSMRSAGSQIHIQGDREPVEMRIIVTGAGGFLGQQLASALVTDRRTTQLILTDVQEPHIPETVQHQKLSCEVRCVGADLAKARDRESLFSSGFDVVYILHGIMSGGAEADLELGLTVNLDSNRALLDTLRAKANPAVKVIYPSSLAVYGPQASGAVTSESTCPNPQSSYGAQKLICETLVNDFSRRGLIDGRVCRLPTIIVRPGKPSSAASSFASSIIREPLLGLEAKLPVPKDLMMWICSPKTVIKNLVYAADIAKDEYARYKSRTVNLPGKTVSVQQMLDALEQVGGRDALSLVKEEPDKAAYDIVASWPDAFDTKRARELGFVEDQDLNQTVRDFLKFHVKKMS